MIEVIHQRAQRKCNDDSSDKKSKENEGSQDINDNNDFEDFNLMKQMMIINNQTSR
jgi:hypothetical protein